MSLDLNSLVRLKWLYPAAVTTDSEARRLLDEVASISEPPQRLWKDTNPYIFWQAFANVSTVRRGFDQTHAELTTIFGHLLEATPQDNRGIEGVVSALMLLTARERRVAEQTRLVSRFVQQFPSSVFGKGLMVRAALFGGDVERAESIFRYSLLPLPLESSLEEKLYWGSVLLMHEELCRFRESFFPVLEKQRFPEQIRQLAASLQAYVPGFLPPRPSAVGALCVSLPADHTRFETSRKLFDKSGIASEKVVGVMGSAVPMTGRLQCARYDIGGGEFGCFMSHVAAWEKVLEMNRPMLVLEDDAAPAFPFSLPDIISSLPEDAELAFVNDRSCAYLDTSIHSGKFLPVMAMQSDRLGRANLLGSDGYILTPRGADRLLAIYRTAGMCLPLDWQLFVSSYEGHFANGVFSSERTRPIFDATLRHGTVKGYALSRPVVRSVDLDYSPLRANS